MIETSYMSYIVYAFYLLYSYIDLFKQGDISLQVQYIEYITFL